MVTFLQWAAELGVSDSIDTSRCRDSCLGHSLSVADFSLAGGRGLGAARELRKGELILKVPRNALMTTDSVVARDQKLGNAVGLYGSLSPTQVEDAVWAAEKAIAKSQSEWKEVVMLMKELDLKPKFQSFQAWLWASATISSRTLHIPWDSAGCLCPVGDLFNYDAPGDDWDTSEIPESAIHISSPRATSTDNHNSLSNVEAGFVEPQSERLTDGGFDEDANAYCLYARRNYQLGDQVLLCYGTYTNLELLEHYGFMLEENSNDKVFIPLESSLYSLASSWPKDSLYIHQDGRPSYALISALRLWLIPQSQREKSVMRLVYAGSQISVKNEILVMKWMSEKCESVLMDLPTSILEDTVVLHNIDKLQDPELCLEQNETEAFGNEVHAFLNVNGLSDAKGFSGKAKKVMSKWRLSVQWRLRYKRILADCISHCNENMNNLSSTQNFIRGV